MSASVGLLLLELHLADAQSLKDRRQTVRSLKDRLRRRFNVSVAETDFQSTITRAEIAVAATAARAADVEQVLQLVEQEAAAQLGRALESSSIEIW